jgi:short-subunit dehydrogenase
MGISGSIEDTNPKDATQLFDVNFMGVFYSTKAVIPHMRASGGGKIFNMSSVAAFLSIPFQSFYSSSKAAINAFTLALANEISPFNIEVCAVCPGDIKTGFTKNRRKNVFNHPAYKNRVEKSVLVMEKDEQNGMEPITAAQAIYKLSNRKRLPVYYTIGFKYKAFVILAKLLPAKFANQMVGSIYGFKKEKKQK